MENKSEGGTIVDAESAPDTVVLWEDGEAVEYDIEDMQVEVRGAASAFHGARRGSVSTDDVTDAIDRVETEDMSFKYVCPKDDCNGSVSMDVDYDEYVYRACPGCGDDITMVKA